MKLTLNENVIRFLCAESCHKFSCCEAFEFLCASITETERKTYTTSYNRLAKEWKWDNHIVNEFLNDLVRIGMFSIQRNAHSVVISFGEAFCENSQGLVPLLSILIERKRKASKAEAFFYIVHKIMSQECHTDAILSCRSLAKELGWSHHTVASFLDFMNENGVICKSPTDDGSAVRLELAE